MRHVAGIPDSSWVTRCVGFETVSADLLELVEFKSRGGGIHGAEQPGFEIRSECGLAIRDVCRCSCGVLVAEDDLAVGAVGPDLTARQVPALPPLLVVGQRRRRDDGEDVGQIGGLVVRAVGEVLKQVVTRFRGGGLDKCSQGELREGLVAAQVALVRRQRHDFPAIGSDLDVHWALVPRHDREERRDRVRRGEHQDVLRGLADHLLGGHERREAVKGYATEHDWLGALAGAHGAKLVRRAHVSRDGVDVGARARDLGHVGHEVGLDEERQPGRVHRESRIKVHDGLGVRCANENEGVLGHVGGCGR